MISKLITTIILSIILYLIIQYGENTLTKKRDAYIIDNYDKIVRYQMINKLNNKKYTKYVDKLQFKQFCKLHGVKYLKTIKVFDISKDVDFKKLGNTFVLKSNKGSGRNIICKNGIMITPFNGKNLYEKLPDLYKIISKWHLPYWNYLKEPQYEFTKPKIYQEEFLNIVPNDIKIMMHKGRIIFIWYVDFHNNERTIYDSSFNVIQCSSSIYHMNNKKKFPLSETLKKQISKVAVKLVKDIDVPIVRVDLYVIDDIIYGSEITLSPAGGKLNIKCTY